MVWDDPRFQALFHVELNKRLSAAYHKAEQTLADYRSEVARLRCENGVQASRAIVAYSAHSIRVPAEQLFDWFHELCADLRLVPEDPDYDHLETEIDGLIDRNQRNGIDSLRAGLVRLPVALGHVSGIEQLARQTRSDLHFRVERKRLVRRASSSNIFISHIGEDAAIAATLKTLLKAALGEHVNVFVSSDYDSLRSG